jgi:hypothetical protein
MVHPDTELRHINDKVGYGVVATHFIPRGTITWASDVLDQKFQPSFQRTLAPILRELVEKYSYVNAAGESVLCWDHARFINHSCDATSLSPGFDFEIAVRDIQAGEQLTDEYGSLNITDSFTCHCLSPRCRNLVQPNDIEKCGHDWDQLVGASFPLIRTVVQPLWTLVAERQQVEQVLDGILPLPSGFRHYRKRNAPDLKK